MCKVVEQCSYGMPAIDSYAGFKMVNTIGYVHPRSTLEGIKNVRRVAKSEIFTTIKRATALNSQLRKRLLSIMRADSCSSSSELQCT